MMYRFALVALLLPQVVPAQAALAQESSERIIQVTGTASVETAPDLALLDIYLRGEGATPDAATTALAAKQKAVTGGVLGLLGAGSELTTSNITVIEARSGTCADGRGYGSQPRLNTGDCAVTGYIATMQNAVRTRNVAKAGTAAGLASRLGASDARLQGFALANPEEAQGRASAAAIAAARQRAEAVASGAGVRLGPIVSVRDQANFEFGAQARVAPGAPPAPPPPSMAAPIPIDLKPKPIETRAQVFVSYAIVP